MIRECPRCGGAIPMDTRTRYEDGGRECPRCRFVTSHESENENEGEGDGESESETTPTRALADGGRETEVSHR